MSGWPEVTLGDLCHIARGGSPRPIKSFLTDAADGINWIKIGDATAGDGKYIASTQEKIRPEGLKRSRFVEPGDFLLSNSMSFGRPYIMQTTGCIHDGWLVLRDKSHRFNPDYLYYFLSSNLAYRQFDALAAGSTVRNLNTDLVKTVKVVLPPLDEQRRIVAVLDEAFAAIATATAYAEKNLANARELFRAIFAQTLAQPGPGWSVMDIGSIADLISGQHIDASDYNSEQRGIGYLTGPSDFGKRSPIVTKWTEHPKRSALRGDILITVKGSGVGSVNVMNEAELAISRQLMAVRVNATDPNLIYYALEAGSEYFQALANGAAIPGISRSDVLGFKIAVPPKIELPIFMKRLHDLRARAAQLAEAYCKKIDGLAALKQSLFDRAFAGELTASMPKSIAA